MIALTREIARAYSRPDFKVRAAALGLDTTAESPEAFSAAVKNDIAKMGALVKQTGARVN